MKVLLVHNEYQIPGGEDVVFRQERQLLTSFGHQVVTYQRSNQEITDYSRLKRLLLVKHLVWAEDAQRDVARMLDREKPDVVHVHNTFIQTSPSIYAVCRKAGVPVVQTLHNFRLLCPAATFYRDGHACEECVSHGLQRGIRHGCYRGSRMATAAVAGMLATHRTLHTWARNISGYIALTEFAKRKFIRGGLPAKKISVKPNFVCPDPGMSLEEGSYALFVGRLSHEKGLRTLLRAWFHFRNSIPLYIVGDGPLRLELEAYAEAKSLSSVRFLGRLSRKETQDAMKGALFLVLPSECYENFPMTIVEAFAAGIPVICSRLGAMQEIVKHEYTGLHFTPGSSADLAYNIARAWSHRARMRGMGMTARLEYEHKYTAEKNHALLMDIYRQAIESRWVRNLQYDRRGDFINVAQNQEP